MAPSTTFSSALQTHLKPLVSPSLLRPRATLASDRAFVNTQTTARRNSNKRSRTDTFNKADSPVGRDIRVLIDESIVLAIMECAYSDSNHQVLGYLGGIYKTDVVAKDAMVCHITQFVSSQRAIPSLLTDIVREIDTALSVAVQTFTDFGCELVGWYRSHPSSNFISAPNGSDITRQREFQSKFPNSTGIIISVTTASRPIIGLRTRNTNDAMNEIFVFRTTSSPNSGSLDKLPLPQPVEVGNPKIWKGKGKETPNYHKVAFSIQYRLYICPKVIQQLTCALLAILRETKEAYSGQVIDCQNRRGQRIFVDSEYESFLMNFLKKSVLQFDKSIDQDFRILAMAKHHTKTLIANRFNEILTAWQKYSLVDENEVFERRRRLKDLVEKLLAQSIDKHEIDFFKHEVIQWGNENMSHQNKEFLRNAYSAQYPIKMLPPLLESPVAFINTSIDSMSESKGTAAKKESPTAKNFKVSSLPYKSQNSCTELDNIQVEGLRNCGNSTESMMEFEPFDRPNTDLKTMAEDQPLISKKQPVIPDQDTEVIEDSPSKSKINNLSTSSESTPLTIISSRSLNTSHILPPQPDNQLRPSSSAHSYVSPTIIATGYRSMLNSPESLPAGLSPPVPSNENTPINMEGSRIHLPSIQGLLDLTSSPPIMPRTTSPLLNGAILDPSTSSSTFHHASSFTNSSFAPYQNNQFFLAGTSTIPRPPTNISSISSPIQSHIIPNKSPSLSQSHSGSNSSTRHYIPIAPSPSVTSTNILGILKTPPLNATTISSTINNPSSSSNNTLFYPTSDHEYRW
ncbi:hypothetical protein G9A89_020931 [Geosiphon pyriformis]|nr:hypothetical protein G9A89_020931 [Geosiphon pyriformis]